MARHPGLPRPVGLYLSKSHILEMMAAIDAKDEIRSRILHIENELNKNISKHIATSTTSNAYLKEFNTNPFVIMMHAKKRSYSITKEIENDILPAKEFSSMETSAGKMIEKVLLP